ncbi:uncharacterized protein LOC129612724 [Condylostylus longicornis]|uniref:uncharacterized protein LOC129612724 n=1 Tax=Condylostylus longicornis TaxID=2530218 RepID=UPI00244DD9E7|nr:uncharacterized protein LOC129612724 [Condylostylus longicornis]
MASASSSSARHLFADSKKRLADRVAVNVNNIGSVSRQIVRGSKTNEILSQTIRDFAQCESAMDNSSENLHKMELIRQHMGYQYESISQNAINLEYIHEQVTAMER